MKRYTTIQETLENMRAADLVAIHNEYCDATNCYDYHIYSMEDFDEIMSGTTPWEVSRCAFYGDFCPAHDYFWFNGYTNLESSDFPLDHIDIEEIAKYICENDDALYSDEIQEILDSFAEESEEE